MDGFKEFMGDGAGAVGSFALTVAGIALGLVLVGTWCLAVFLLTGRFPWFVRRYF